MGRIADRVDQDGTTIRVWGTPEPAPLAGSFVDWHVRDSAPAPAGTRTSCFVCGDDTTRLHKVSERRDRWRERAERWEAEAREMHQRLDRVAAERDALAEAARAVDADVVRRLSVAERERDALRGQRDRLRRQIDNYARTIGIYALRAYRARAALDGR